MNMKTSARATTANTRAAAISCRRRGAGSGGGIGRRRGKAGGGEAATCFERVDFDDRFVGANPRDTWKTQGETALVPVARLNRIERDLQDRVRHDHAVPAMV